MKTTAIFACKLKSAAHARNISLTQKICLRIQYWPTDFGTSCGTTTTRGSNLIKNNDDEVAMEGCLRGQKLVI